MHQLEGNIVGVLARNAWICRARTVAVGAMARGAYLVDDLLCMRGIGLGARSLNRRLLACRS